MPRPVRQRRTIPVWCFQRSRRHVCAGGVALSYLHDRCPSDIASVHGCRHGIAGLDRMARGGAEGILDHARQRTGLARRAQSLTRRCRHSAAPRMDCHRFRIFVIIRRETSSLFSRLSTVSSFSGAASGGTKGAPPRSLTPMNYRLIAAVAAVFALSIPAVAADSANRDVKGLYLLTDYPAVTVRP